MIRKLTIGFLFVATIGICFAEVPSKDELAAASEVVADILASKVEAMKDGKAKPSEVADYALSLMGEAETPAAKYMLAGNAYAYYMKGGDYAKAVEAIGMMREAIPDIPADRLLKALSPAAKGVSANKAPEVHAILADLQGKVQSQGEIAKIKAQLKAAKVSERPLLYRKLGESYAVIGDWTHALENLSKGDGEIAKLAQSELGGTESVGKLAGAWWDASEKKGLKPAVASSYRQYAAELYQKGLDDGSISGLSKKLAEQRIEEAQKASCAVLSTETTIKQRVPKGLVHRWSFNGNLKDSVGNVEARPNGNWKLDGGQCVLNLGWISMNEAAKDCKGSFSLEVWTTEIKRTYGSRVFCLKSSRGPMFGWATGEGKEGYFHAIDCLIKSGDNCRGFVLGEETYVAMTCKEMRDLYEITAYEYDYPKKKMSSFCATLKKDEFSSIDKFYLGHALTHKFSDAQSSFNECRVWNRALSKSEIERSAKAGPDKFGF